MSKKLFVPANFPQEKEKELLTLLYSLEKDFIRKIPKDSKEFSRLILDKINTKTKPSNWWFTFLLMRHEALFSKKFVSRIKPFLVKTKTRSLSGIVALSLFTKGVGCPFNCIYCPNEPGMPKSYFSDEPAVMRAIRHGFDPYLQTQQRLVMLALSGHPLDKVEIIIKGGTFSYYPKKYRTWFVKRIFDACNTEVVRFIKTGLQNHNISKSLQEAQSKNESAYSRIIGINIETRPDFIDKKEIIFLRNLGVTHVEMGVQALDDLIYKKIQRGHTVKDVKNATLLLKEAGFKVGYHLMPNLPGSTQRHDLTLLKKTFFDMDFKPDHLKLYPTTITSHSSLHKWYILGRYRPYDNKELINIIIKFKSKICPPWTRIGRLTRDITTKSMRDVWIVPNLRELIQEQMKIENVRCHCIRCREIKDLKTQGKTRFRFIKYQASEGVEYFLEYVDKAMHSLGFLRLRLPSYLTHCCQPIYKSLKNCALVRELHIYGQSTPIGKKGNTMIQHHMYGKKLMYEAEKIVKKHNIRSLAVIAGIGTRSYYRKLGYTLKKTYMIKIL